MTRVADRLELLFHRARRSRPSNAAVATLAVRHLDQDGALAESVSRGCPSITCGHRGHLIHDADLVEVALFGFGFSWDDDEAPARAVSICLYALSSRSRFSDPESEGYCADCVAEWHWCCTWPSTQCKCTCPVANEVPVVSEGIPA